MPSESTVSAMLASSESHLQVAHILFMDMVGYSRLQIDLQKTLTGELQEIVSSTLEFTRASEQQTMICRPTGDGMALIFFSDMLAPLRCAVEISSALRTRPRIKIRMGIHSGPLYIVSDINGNADVQGDGIVMAQRVMDCGDEGHILLSSALAGMLSKVKPWALHLTDVGTCTIKHGDTIQIYNLTSKEFGNSRFPRKVMAQRAASVQTLRTVSTTHREAAEPGNRILSYLMLFVLSFIMSCGTTWLISPTFRNLCGTAFALSAPKSSAPLPGANPSLSSNNSVGSTGNGGAFIPVPSMPDLVISQDEDKTQDTGHGSGKRKSNHAKHHLPKQDLPGGNDHAEDGIHKEDGTAPVPIEDFNPADVSHHFHAVARLPEDGRGQRIVHVTYKYGDVTEPSETEPVGEGETISLDCDYKGTSLTVRIEYRGSSVYEHVFTPSSPDAVSEDIDLPR